jgi:hypothetical protein
MALWQRSYLSVFRIISSVGVVVMVKRKLDKFEKRIMLNLHVVSFLCLLASVLQIVLPLAEKQKFTFLLLSQIVAIAASYVNGWINARGAQILPIVPAFIIRGVQFLLFVVWARDLSYLSFGILLFFDGLLIALLAIDKAMYRYEVVAVENDEFYDAR